jgi:hypothetical protein
MGEMVSVVDPFIYLHVLAFINRIFFSGTTCRCESISRRERNTSDLSIFIKLSLLVTCNIVAFLQEDLLSLWI